MNKLICPNCGANNINVETTVPLRMCNGTQKLVDTAEEHIPKKND